MDTKKASCFQLSSWHLSCSYCTEYFTVFNIKEEQRENCFFSPQLQSVWALLLTGAAYTEGWIFLTRAASKVKQGQWLWQHPAHCALNAAIIHVCLIQIPVKLETHTPRQAGGRSLIPPSKKTHEVPNKMRLHSHLHRSLRVAQSEIEFSLLSWLAKPIPSHIWPQLNNWIDLMPTNYNLPQRKKQQMYHFVSMFSKKSLEVHSTLFSNITVLIHKIYPFTSATTHKQQQKRPYLKPWQIFTRKSQKILRSCRRKGKKTPETTLLRLVSYCSTAPLPWLRSQELLTVL